MQLIRIIAGVSLLLIAVVIGGVMLEKIERVEVTGYHPHVDLKTLRMQLKEIDNKSWWLLDEEALSDELSELAWVREVTVNKRWPKSVLITLQEHEPILRWKGNYLISKTGQWFIPNNEELSEWAHLPKVESSTQSLNLLLPILYQAKEAFDKNNIELESLKITPWKTIEFTLKSGSQIVFDEKDILKKINEIMIFIKLNPDYDGKSIKRIDLRYNNGFSISNIKRS